MCSGYLHSNVALWKFLLQIPNSGDFPMHHHHHWRHNHRTTTTPGVVHFKHQLSIWCSHHHLIMQKGWLGRDFGFVPLSLTLEEGDESWRLTRQERRQGIGRRAARKKGDATPKKNCKNSLNQAFQKLPRRPIRPDTERWRPDASVGCSSCSSIYTIFHHPNHLESFTKVVPKTLICLGDQLSSPFHLIHCTFPLETSRSTKEQTLGDLEAKRSEEEGASIILETSRAAGFHHWDFLNSLFIFI